jgi:heterotetrameric sarcosine oxidase beta subunit
MAVPGATRSELRSSYDVVIIGAGIHGLALAHGLADRGIRNVAVLEARWPGSGASGRNGELIRSAFGTPEWIRFYEHSVRLWHQLSAKLDFNVLFTPGGYTVIASNEDDLERCRSAVVRQQELGVQTRYITADEIRELVPAIAPETALGGYHQADGGYAHHDAVVWGYAQAAARMGVEIHPYTTVEQVLTDAGKVRGVVTNRGQTSAPIVVNAAGAFSHEVAAMAGVDLPLERFRIEAFVTESLQPFMRPAISLISLHGYAHQTSRGEFVGGTEFALPDKSDSLQVTWPMLIDMAQKFVRVIPQLAGARVARHWAGNVSQAADLAAVLGPVPELEGFWLSCGWLYGFMGGPASGDLLAESIATGRVHEYVEPFGIERLRTGKLIADGTLIQKPEDVMAGA